MNTLSKTFIYIISHVVWIMTQYLILKLYIVIWSSKGSLYMIIWWLDKYVQMDLDRTWFEACADEIHKAIMGTKPTHASRSC